MKKSDEELIKHLVNLKNSMKEIDFILDDFASKDEVYIDIIESFSPSLDFEKVFTEVPFWVEDSLVKIVNR